MHVKCFASDSFDAILMFCYCIFIHFAHHKCCNPDNNERKRIQLELVTVCLVNDRRNKQNTLERVESFVFIKLCHLKGHFIITKMHFVHWIQVFCFDVLIVPFVHIEITTNVWLHDELCESTNRSGTFQVSSTFHYFDWFQTPFFQLADLIDSELNL